MADSVTAIVVDGEVTPPLSVPFHASVQTYRSNTAIRRAWSQRLRRYVPIGRLPQRRRLCPVDADWFRAAARACPSHRDKIPDSDCVLYVDRADKAFSRMPPRLVSRHVKKNACVFVETDAGPRALSGKLDIRRAESPKCATSWMRQAIQRQIDLFRARESRGDARCHLCAKSLKGKLSHVDHGVGEFSFKDIARRFLQKMEGLHGQHASERGASAQNALRRRWQQFHRKHARLSMACVSCNLANK